MTTTKKEKSILTDEDNIGQVFILKTSRGLFPFPLKREAEVERYNQTRSQQIKDATYTEGHDLVSQPFSTAALLFLQDNSPFFDACVRQIATDVVGHGYELKLRDGASEDKEEKARIENFLEDPNDEDEDIADVIEKCIIDWGVIGWLGAEVARDEDDKIIGLWHVPAHTLRVHRSKERFCQLRLGQRMWFRKFGSDVQISAKTGEDVKTKKLAARELIYLRRYWPQSDYYGAPPVFSAVGSVMGMIGIRDFNLAIFDNYGIPASIVSLKGRWAKDAAKNITNFVDVEIRGTSNQHKTLVVKPPRDGSLEWNPLTEKVDEAAFKLYLKILRDEILSVYKMPPYRIGIAEVGSLGGSTSPEATKIYGESIIHPLKLATGHLITKKILRDGLGAKSYIFRWKELDTRDLDALVNRCYKLFSMGAMNPDQIAETFNLPKPTLGEQYYVASNFVPAGESTLKRMESTYDATLEDIVSDIAQVKTSILPLVERLEEI